MKSGVILLLTDRTDRSEPLQKVIDHVADCQTVVVGEPWKPTSAVIGLIADASLSCLRTRIWLQDLLKQVVPRFPPALYLTASMSLAALHQAKAYGASLCLPSHAEPRAVVAALIHQISPTETVTDLAVGRAAERTGRFFDHLFLPDANTHVDIDRVDRAVTPVLDAIRIGGLKRWLDTIWTYDDATFQHCMLVAGLVAGFSFDLGLSKADQAAMTRGALVHDIGKTRIPKEILNKPGRLDPDEMALMRTHAAVGHAILSGTTGCDPMTLAMTRHHHEMLDGSGYPDQLSGNAIADPIRLLTICDIYAALIERRPYKTPYTTSKAMQVLQEMEGKLEGGLIQAFGMSVAKMG